MPRQYDTTFRRPNGALITIRSRGNTRRSAAQRARSKLHRNHKIDPQKCTTLATVVKGAARDKTKKRAYDRKYYLANKGKITAQVMAWRNKNKPKMTQHNGYSERSASSQTWRM